MVVLESKSERSRRLPSQRIGSKVQKFHIIPPEGGVQLQMKTK